MAPVISFIASIDAFNALLYPWSSLACTASTTTMASSTTMAMARSNAESTSKLMVNPNIHRKRNVPIRATGTAIIGISVERKSWRNTYTTRNTSKRVSTRVNTTSSIAAKRNSVTSMLILYSIPGGNDFACFSSSAFTSAAICVALEPAICCTIPITEGWPLFFIDTL